MRYRAIDELAHFRFHDASIVRQEWEGGNFIWILEALNVTTDFSGCDFEVDQEIALAWVTFEDACALQVDVARIAEKGRRRARSDEAEWLIAARSDERGWAWIFDLYQNEGRRAIVDIMDDSNGALYALTLAFSRVLIEWDAYKGAAWYTERVLH